MGAILIWFCRFAHSCRFAHLQRMELCIILIIGTFEHWETEYHKKSSSARDQIIIAPTVCMVPPRASRETEKEPASGTGTAIPKVLCILTSGMTYCANTMQDTIMLTTLWKGVYNQLAFTEYNPWKNLNFCSREGENPQNISCQRR